MTSKKVIGTGKFNEGDMVLVKAKDIEGHGIVVSKELLWHPEHWGFRELTPRWAYMVTNNPFFREDSEDVEGLWKESNLTLEGKGVIPDSTMDPLRGPLK